MKILNCLCLTSALLAAFFCVFSTVSCNKETSITDITTVKDINAFITKRDLANGVEKTMKSITRVTFSHQRHEKAQITCEQCHHKHSNEEKIKICAYCHKGIAGAETVHNNCIGCHKEMKKGPATCDTCHSGGSNLLENEEMKKQYAASEAYKQNDVHKIHNKLMKCTVCHHEHGRRNAKDSHEKCSRCHTGISKMKILHVFCKDCHIKAKKGPVHCKACHTTAPELKVGNYITLPKTGHRKPPIRFSHKEHIEKYNTECIDCHHTHTNEKCTNCHKMKEQGAIINLKSAFHQQCNDCHRKTAGPQACGGCHAAK